MNSNLADRRHEKYYTKMQGRVFSMRTDTAIVKSCTELVPGTVIFQPSKGTKDAERAHFKQTPQQICEQIDKHEVTQRYNRALKKDEPFSRYMKEQV